MGIHNDEALLRLPENFRQPNRGKLTASEHIAKGETGSHRRKLIRISHQNQTLSLRNRQQQTVQQLYIHHGHFVHDHSIRFQRVVLIPKEEHFARMGINIRFQQPVNGGSILAGDLRQPLGSPPRGRSQQAFELHLSKK